MSENTTKTKNTCIEEGCKKQPSFNFEGLKKLYCAQHKLNGMIDVTHKTCLEDTCNIRPCYNFEDQKKGLYCVKHKKPGMIDITHKTCLEDTCNIRASFNFEDQKKGLYCVKHKKPGMIDITNKTCLEDTCNIRPCYNFEDQKKGLYCVKHKKPGMIDITHKTCLEDTCNIRASFNFEDQKKGLYCVKHKKPGMIDIIHKTCKSEWCDTRFKNKKYDGYCLYCYINLFPEKPVSRNYKTKEFAVVEFVKAKFPHVDWIADKMINGGCSKKRPDLLLDLGYQILIIEIDENQHINYDCSCENKRIMELSADMGHRPIVFIRFNPDTYIKDGKKITSCWGNNQKGICVIKKGKTKEWKNRLNSLEELIIYWLKPENKTNKVIETIELYYDI